VYDTWQRARDGGGHNGAMKWATDNTSAAPKTRVSWAGGIKSSKKPSFANANATGIGATAAAAAAAGPPTDGGQPVDRATSFTSPRPTRTESSGVKAGRRAQLQPDALAVAAASGTVKNSSAVLSLRSAFRGGSQSAPAQESTVNLARASVMAKALDVRRTGSVDTATEYRDAVDMAISRHPSGIGLTTIDGRAAPRKRNSQLSLLSDELEAEQSALKAFRSSYHLRDLQHDDALRAQERLTALAEASRLLSLRDNLRMQRQNNADIDELRERQQQMVHLMREAHAKLIGRPDTGADGDFQQAVSDGTWTAFPMDETEEDRLFARCRDLLGSSDPTETFRTSAGATELAAKHATARGRNFASFSSDLMSIASAASPPSAAAAAAAAAPASAPDLWPRGGGAGSRRPSK